MDLKNEFGCWGGDGGCGIWGKGIVRKPGIDMYILLYLKWRTNKDLTQIAWNFAQCYVTAWMEGEFGGEWILVYVWLSPFTVLSPETITTVLIGDTLIQKKKFFKK